MWEIEISSRMAVSAIRCLEGKEAYTKNPATLPMASMVAAQAFPAGCLAVGRVSTRSARSKAWTREDVRLGCVSM